MTDTHNTAIWQRFALRNGLSDEKLKQFKQYAAMLQDYNDKFNLTALTETEDIVDLHFQDSLEIMRFIDISASSTIADVGTGAGFPAIPLKIMFPEIPFVLIEVNNKKVGFLQEVLAALGLQGVEFVTDDWRTFLRHTKLPIDLFLARASLHPDELLRIYKGQSYYAHARMIYWASQHWEPREQEKKYIRADVPYVVGGKKRRYIIFSQGDQK